MHWNPAASLPGPLTFVSKRFAVSRLKLRIADCSAPTGQPENGESGPSSPAGSRSRPGQGQTGSGLACSASLLVGSDATNPPGRPCTRWGAILRGVSTGAYEEVLPDMAQTVKRCARNARTSSRFWCYRHLEHPSVGMFAQPHRGRAWCGCPKPRLRCWLRSNLRDALLRLQNP